MRESRGVTVMPSSMLAPFSQNLFPQALAELPARHGKTELARLARMIGPGWLRTDRITESGRRQTIDGFHWIADAQPRGRPSQNSSFSVKP